MAFTLSPNLGLRLDSGLTANAKYNLLVLDTLGGTTTVDSTGITRMRGRLDLSFSANDASVGGSGSGGNVTFGTQSQPLTSLAAWTSSLNLSGSLRLGDSASSGTLSVGYNSTAGGFVADTGARTLTLNPVGGNRKLVLAGDFTTAGSISLSGPAAVTLPPTGTLSTLSGTETLTNKSIDGGANTITGLTAASLSPSAGIPYSKLALAGTIQNSDIASGASIAYAKLNLAGSVQGSDLSPFASIPYSKLALTASLQNSDIAGGAGIVLNKLAPLGANSAAYTDSSGFLTSAPTLPTSRGGTGVSGSAVFPSTGTVQTDSSTATLTNKTMSGAANTFSGIGYSSLSLAGSVVNADISAGAHIAYSKLNLTGSVLAADIAPAAGIPYSKLTLTGGIVDADVSGIAAIAGTKIQPAFGNQMLSTDQGIQFRTGGLTTTLGGPSAPAQNWNFLLPAGPGTPNQVLFTDGAGNTSWGSLAGTGTVTSVGLAAPAEFSVSGSPVIVSGTLTLTKANQSANTVWAGPTTGAAAAPTFRTLVAADIPAGNLTTTTTGLTVGGGTGAVVGAGATINVQTASGSQPGLLSAADWTTFNNKQSALTPGSISTSTTGVTVGSGANSTVGPNVTVNVQTSSGSQPGLLSAADWTTFNNKQPAGSYITALTGDVTAAGPGSVAATIAALSVTNAKIANATIDLTTKVTGTLPVVNGGTGTTTSTGTGSVVLSNSPTLVTPALGTPSAAVLTNATGLPLTTGVTGVLPAANGGSPPTTRTLFVDGGRTDSYTADGSAGRPFKTIQAAINQVITNADNSTHPYTLLVYPGSYAESLTLNSSTLYNLNFTTLGSTTTGLGSAVSLTGSPAISSTSNNTQLASLVFSGFQLGGGVTLTGDVNNTNFGSTQIAFLGCDFEIGGTTINWTNVNNINVYGGQFNGAGTVTITNLAFAYIADLEGFHAGTTLVLVQNNAGNQPSQGSGNYLLMSNTKNYATVTIDAGSEWDFIQGYQGTQGAVTNNGIVHSFHSVWEGTYTGNSGSTLRVDGDVFKNTPTINSGATLTPRGTLEIATVQAGFDASAGGVVKVANGGASGKSVSIQNTAATTAWNFNLPTAAGSSGQPLLSGGGGSTSQTYGTLGIGAGGTGQTSASAAFNALSPMTTAGDLIYGGVAGAGTRLGVGSTGQVLTVSGGNPVWAAPGSSSSFHATWSTADGTTKAVTHSLGTRNVIVQLYDGATFDTVDVSSVIRTDVNTVTLTSASAPGASGWIVLIQATN